MSVQAGVTRKVLMIAPHFPPDSSAGAHRVRLLAPHLCRFGWTPTVLTVHPSYYEGLLDPRFAALVPRNLRVERSGAVSVRIARLFGVGDLGLRSFRGLHKKAVELLSSEKYDALFITIYPTYPALLGPLLKRRFGVPFVLDYQDPWVGAWGKTVGAGRGGGTDIKSRLSRALALLLEPLAVKAADAITAVSVKTVDTLVERMPTAGQIPTFAIPIGGEANDFEHLRSAPRLNAFFHPNDGNFHICYVGTILPLGGETLRAVLSAFAVVRETRPDLYRHLRAHFLGTSNERTPGTVERVMQAAREIGVSDVVAEHPMRIDYTDALAVQVQASALLLMGSSEHHYTASKLYPAMLAKRPLLAVYHRLSSVSSILGSRPARHIRLVQFGDDDRPGTHIGQISEELISLMETRHEPMDLNPHPMDDSLAARNLAGKLAGIFDKVASPSTDLHKQSLSG